MAVTVGTGDMASVDGDVRCTWFDKGHRRHEEWFPPDALKRPVPTLVTSAPHRPKKRAPK
jgi:uncharacterized protein YodC (DUF2158 family)